jgi:hypothetical protein
MAQGHISLSGAARGARPLGRASRRARLGGSASVTEGGRGGRGRGRCAGEAEGARRGAARGGARALGARAGRLHGEEEGEGEGKREREKERERERERGAHLDDPNSSDHRLQDLGHHEEREREREVGERLLRGRNQMRERDQGRGARTWEGHGRQGRAGRGWAGLRRAGLGCTAGQNPVARTTTDRKINSRNRNRNETKQHT